MDCGSKTLVVVDPFMDDVPQTVWAGCRESDEEKTCGWQSHRKFLANPQTSGIPVVDNEEVAQFHQEHLDHIEAMGNE